MMLTAFQIGAFQFTGFQEGLAAGSGGRIVDYRGMFLSQLRRWQREEARRRKKEEEEPELPEVTALRLTAAPIIRVPKYVQLASLRTFDRMAFDRQRELEEFEALVKSIFEAEEY